MRPCQKDLGKSAGRQESPCPKQLAAIGLQNDLGLIWPFFPLCRIVFWLADWLLTTATGRLNGLARLAESFMFDSFDFFAQIVQLSGVNYSNDFVKHLTLFFLLGMMFEVIHQHF